MISSLTFSGGVGELVYMLALGETVPSTTFFGDLGIDLAKGILSSQKLSSSLSTMVPETKGHATVYGMAIHSMSISGSTLFLPKPESLPLRDIPVVSRLTFDAKESVIQHALSLIDKSPHGGCIQILSTESHSKSAVSLEQIKLLGSRMSKVLREKKLSPLKPIILMVPNNIGKTIGNYATNWNQLQVNLIVIDEIPDRNAHFLNLGRPYHGVVPVSFYGIQ